MPADVGKDSFLQQIQSQNDLDVVKSPAGLDTYTEKTGWKWLVQDFQLQTLEMMSRHLAPDMSLEAALNTKISGVLRHFFKMYMGSI